MSYLAPQRPQLLPFNETLHPRATHFRSLNLRLVSSQRIIPDQEFIVWVPFGVPGATTAQDVRKLCVRFASNALMVQGWIANNILSLQEPMALFTSGRITKIRNWGGFGVSSMLEELIASGGTLAFVLAVENGSIVRVDGTTGPPFAGPPSAALCPGAVPFVLGGGISAGPVSGAGVGGSG